MQVLVTGANGFIGRELVKLLDNKFEVIGADISGRDLIWCDLTKLSAIQTLFSKYAPDIIVHLAAISSTHQSYQDAIQTQKVNFMGTVNLLEIAQDMNSNLKYFVLASSAEVYGGVNQDIYSERDLPQPISPYASSKVAAESFVIMKGRDSALKTCCIRFCNTFGRLNDINYLVEYLFHCFLTNTPPVLKTPDSVRQFMYLPDHLKVYELILHKQPSGILNASSGDACRILEMASKIKEITGSKTEIKTASEYQTTKIILNTERLEKLGFKPNFSLQRGLLAFHRQLKRGPLF